MKRDQRKKNIETLKKMGYIESGLYSTSGCAYVKELNHKTIVVYGTRSNIAGKYFSLIKYFPNLTSAKKEIEELRKILTIA